MTEAAPPNRRPKGQRSVEPVRAALSLAESEGLPRETLPLYAGAMHYWRHPPEEWGPGLDAIKSLGLRVVDTYVPWAAHELDDGTFDFGERERRLDVGRFLAMAHERGLYVIARPGPHINAELTFFGIPERVVWNAEAQARTPKGNPVMLPMLPLSFPVPSYASETFHEETRRWFEAVAPVLAPHVYPSGPIVLLQVDNEGALYFRDGPFDQDYHPDAVLLFRDFLRKKYGSSEALAHAWSDATVELDTATPPVRFDATSLDELVRAMDWMEFHEHLLAVAMERMSKALLSAASLDVPTMHNFPMGEGATPLNPAGMTSIDFVGLDYYQRAHPIDHLIVMRRTSELATRCDGQNTPAFGAEVGAGFPPFFAPLGEADSLYTLMAALAYGLRGFNLYMAVERDRWVGAPIDSGGRRRPFADRYEALIAALERTAFHTLRRRAPVRLVIPRSLRRIARATHAFGSATPALFHVLGASLKESCFEEGYCEGEAPPIVAEGFLRAFERALSQRGVPFAYVGGEALDVSLDGATWIVCPTVGGIKGEVLESLRRATKRGARATIGPEVPTRDGNLRRLAAPHDTSGLEVEPLSDFARVDALVSHRIDELSLPTYPVDPEGASFALHEDAAGVPRVCFVMNPTDDALVVRLSFDGARALVDALDGSVVVKRAAGGFEVPVKAKTVRMFTVGHVTSPALVTGARPSTRET